MCNLYTLEKNADAVRCLFADLTSLVSDAQRRYVESNPESRRLHEERSLVMPGGNTRTVIHVEPFPLTIVRGEGARLTDADGHVYVDFLGEYTAGLYGHSHPVILEDARQREDVAYIVIDDEHVLPGEHRVRVMQPLEHAPLLLGQLGFDAVEEECRLVE